MIRNKLALLIVLTFVMAALGFVVTKTAFHNSVNAATPPTSGAPAVQNVNLDQARNLAGFEIALPSRVPSGFLPPTTFAVSEMKTQSADKVVQHIWRSGNDDKAIFVFTQTPAKFEIGDGQPARVAGTTGQEHYVVPSNGAPSIMTLGWESSGMYFALSGRLSGSLDRDAMRDIAASVKFPAR